MGVTVPEGEQAILGENVPDKPNTPVNCELDWSMQRRAYDRQTLDCKRWTSLLSAAKGDFTPQAMSDIYDCLVSAFVCVSVNVNQCCCFL